MSRLQDVGADRRRLASTADPSRVRAPLTSGVDAHPIQALQSRAGNQAVATLVRSSGAAGVLRIQRDGGFGQSTPAGGFGNVLSKAAAERMDTTPVELLSYTQLQDQIRINERWLAEQTTSTRESAARERRVAAMRARLETVVKAATTESTKKDARKKGKDKGPAVPKPKSLGLMYTMDNLSDADAAAEVDAIVAYLATKPPKRERKRLLEMEAKLSFQLDQSRSAQDEGHRRKRIAEAMTPKSDDIDGMFEIARKVDAIHKNPSMPGTFLLGGWAGERVVVITEAEYNSIRSTVGDVIVELSRQFRGVIDNAYWAWWERTENNNDHPVVHGLVKFASGAEDISSKEAESAWKHGWDGRKKAIALVHAGKFEQATRVVNAMSIIGAGFAKRVADWNEQLMGAAGRWVLALTILKEGLTMVATAGAAGAVSTLVAKGASLASASAKVAALTTVTGAASGMGGSIAEQASRGKGVDIGTAFGAARTGGGAGFSIGAPTGVTAAFTKVYKVGQAASAGGNLLRGVVAETGANVVVNVTAAVISGESKTNAVRSGTIGGVTGNLGGKAVEKLAKGKKAAIVVGKGFVGGAGNAASGLATGQSRQELLIGTISGTAGGAYGQHVSDKAAEQSNGVPVVVADDADVAAAGRR